MKVRFSHWPILHGPVKYLISYIYKHNITHYIMFNKIIIFLSLPESGPHRYGITKHLKSSLYVLLKKKA